MTMKNDFLIVQEKKASRARVDGLGKLKYQFFWALKTNLYDMALNRAVNLNSSFLDLVF